MTKVASPALLILVIQVFLGFGIRLHEKLRLPIRYGDPVATIRLPQVIERRVSQLPVSRFQTLAISHLVGYAALSETDLLGGIRGIDYQAVPLYYPTNLPSGTRMKESHNGNRAPGRRPSSIVPMTRNIDFVAR